MGWPQTESQPQCADTSKDPDGEADDREGKA